MRPSYPKAEEHGIEGEVRPATLPEILDLIETKSAGIQDTITEECLGHLTLALSMLHDQQTSDREQLEDLRSRFNKEAEVGTDDEAPPTEEWTRMRDFITRVADADQDLTDAMLAHEAVQWIEQAVSILRTLPSPPLNRTVDDEPDIDPLTCDPVNGHLAGGMTAEEIITHERLHAGFQQERMQKLQSENIELERQLADKDREIAQLKNRLEQIQRVTKGW